tara:strand:- start:7 stop:246 length:240 start_codon:yes stop_codon:yes gene_type:complete
MLNPLVDSLADFSLNQLEDKINELQRKYFMTSNQQVQLQMSTILEIYKEELYTRRAIEANRQREQNNGGSGLDKLIKVS